MWVSHCTVEGGKGYHGMLLSLSDIWPQQWPHILCAYCHLPSAVAPHQALRCFSACVFLLKRNSDPTISSASALLLPCFFNYRPNLKFIEN